MDGSRFREDREQGKRDGKKKEAIESPMQRDVERRSREGIQRIKMVFFRQAPERKKE